MVMSKNLIKKTLFVLVFIVGCVSTLIFSEEVTLTTIMPSAANSSFSRMKIYRYNNSNIETWTVPSGVTKIMVEAVGGGGSGATLPIGGGGGGGGGYVKAIITVTKSAYYVKVGNTSYPSFFNDNATLDVNSLIYAGAGIDGDTFKGGNGGGANFRSSTIGLDNGIAVGGGAGANGTASSGGAGIGGSSFYGGGGRGPWIGDGGNGSGYGGGGGGSAGAGYSGGIGVPGIVIIYY